MIDYLTMCQKAACLAAVALSLSAATVLPSPVIAQIAAQNTTQPSAKGAPPSRSLIQKLRAFLGLNPPVAVGGSRSGGGQSVCLLSPWPDADRKNGSVPVAVLVGRPVLLAAGPLNEVRIEQGNQILWQERASSTKAIEGPITWPIRPLLPGEQITLKLRPRGASGGDFATFSLRVADANRLADNDRQIQAMGADSSAITRFLEQLKPQQAGLAAAVLAQPEIRLQLGEIMQCSGH